MIISPRTGKPKLQKGDGDAVLRMYQLAGIMETWFPGKIGKSAKKVRNATGELLEAMSVPLPDVEEDDDGVMADEQENVAPALAEPPKAQPRPTAPRPRRTRRKPAVD